jgi:TRAP-type mannitol/chloroaromatic compound transport system permease small subunit
MGPWLGYAKLWDRVSEWTGWIASWLVLLAVLVSAGNAFSRYLFDLSSNGWLELQWYMFTGMVLLGASVTLRVNEHVRVDVFYGGRSPRAKAWIDLLGLLFFLMPTMLVLAWLSWPLFVDAWIRNEVSSNAGGLVRWPVKLLMPVGFLLVALQGLAEIIKRIGFLRGTYTMDTHYEKPLQ